MMKQEQMLLNLSNYYKQFEELIQYTWYPTSIQTDVSTDIAIAYHLGYDSETPLRKQFATYTQWGTIISHCMGEIYLKTQSSNAEISKILADMPDSLVWSMRLLEACSTEELETWVKLAGDAIRNLTTLTDWGNITSTEKCISYKVFMRGDSPFRQFMPGYFPLQGGLVFEKAVYAAGVHHDQLGIYLDTLTKSIKNWTWEKEYLVDKLTQFIKRKEKECQKN